MSKKRKKSANSTKHCTYYADGMHCASCEVLIEKRLLEEDGIKSVNARLQNGKVDITYEGENPPSSKKVNKMFAELGYKFSDKKFKVDNTPLIKLSPSGTFLLNKSKANNLLKILAILVSFVVVFYFFEKLQLGQYVNVTATSSLPAFFLLGLVAGVSSCAALVGGLLLSMVKQWNELYLGVNDESEKATPHIMFHVGRIVSFALLGGVLGLAGDIVTLNNPLIFSVLTIVISLIMLALALQMLQVSWATKIKLIAPKFISRYTTNEKNFQGKYMPFVTGGLTFFLPCGFTLLAQTIALTTGNFFNGAMIMVMFALGTFPILAGISFSGIKLNKKPHMSAKFNVVAGLIIIFFVIYNVNGQMNVLGLPSLSDISITKASQSDPKSDVPIAKNSEGVQILTFIAKGFEYIPTSSTTIKADIPTIMKVDNQGIQGCGSFMAARGLLDGYVSLKRGENIIEFMPKKGTYKLTCTMGMVSPVTIKVI